MTPEEAKSWLQTTDTYEFDEGTVCDALETIAGLRYEYAVAGVDNDGKTIPPKTWFPNRYEANIAAMCVNTVETHVVRRLVSDVEVVDE